MRALIVSAFAIAIAIMLTGMNIADIPYRVNFNAALSGSGAVIVNDLASVFIDEFYRNEKITAEDFAFKRWPFVSYTSEQIWPKTSWDCEAFDCAVPLL